MRSGGKGAPSPGTVGNGKGIASSGLLGLLALRVCRRRGRACPRNFGARKGRLGPSFRGLEFWSRLSGERDRRPADGGVLEVTLLQHSEERAVDADGRIDPSSGSKRSAACWRAMGKASPPGMCHGNGEQRKTGPTLAGECDEERVVADMTQATPRQQKDCDQRQQAVPLPSYLETVWGRTVKAKPQLEGMI